MIFKDSFLPVINQSIKRAYIKSEEERQAYATELMDHYQGFSKKYLEEMITNSIKYRPIQETMKKLAVSYPLLKFFINKVSSVYSEQPNRTFYQGDKILISELDEFQQANKEKYIVNKALCELLTGIYDRKLLMAIKKAERMTNLLSTTLYKINNRDGHIVMDFVPNDTVTIAQDSEDLTRMKELYFIRDYETNATFQRIDPVYEKWTPDSFAISKGNKKVQEDTNRASAESEIMYKSKFIDSGFAPFVVFRSDVSDTDFWNLKDDDVITVIKQLNMAFTELRYLQRFGSFGLKYVINGKVDEGSILDPTGFISITEPKGVPGGDNKVEVGELENKADINAIVESISYMVKFLYGVYNINTSNLMASAQVQSADSKVLDEQNVEDAVNRQREIWAINEENLFKVIASVWNRDNTVKIPADVKISVDYVDTKESAIEKEKEITNWILMIDNNIRSHIDWVMAENPDLSVEEAMVLYDKNVALNDSNDIEPEVPDNGNMNEDDQSTTPV